MTLLTSELDGKKIGYSDETEFLVEVSINKTKKSRFRTVARYVGRFDAAVMHYNAINIGLGYRKRLVMPSSKKPVLARATS